MVPLFVRVSSTLEELIEDKVNVGESKVNLTSYLSKATLDIIGLVGNWIFLTLIIFVFTHFYANAKLFSLYFFLGFSYEFNSLTSSNELAEAYEFLMTPSRAIFSFIAGSIPFTTQIPIDHNIRMDNACKVVEHESKRIIEKKISWRQE